MWTDSTDPQYPRHPGSLENLEDVKHFIDGYDCGVRFADDNVAQVVASLKELGVFEDTAIIITSDHGENIGELGIYGEHATADHPCCHIPMIIKWPGLAASSSDDGLRLNIDLAPTLAELLGTPAYHRWDGTSYAGTLRGEDIAGRECAVLNQCAHVCQRSVVFGGHLYIRTLHGGYHLFDDEMLFNIENDPHQTRNLLAERPDLAAEGARLLLNWEYEMMQSSVTDVDPMWTVLREGGPLHARGQLPAYLVRLENTGRVDGANALRNKYRRELEQDDSHP